MQTLHQKLVKKFPWYQKYHNLKYHQPVNLLVFGTFTIFVFLVIASSANVLPKLKSSQSEAAFIQKGDKVKYTVSRFLPLAGDKSSMPELSAEKPKTVMDKISTQNVERISNKESGDSSWELLSNLSPFVAQDVSFSNQLVGYIAGYTDQNGQVLKTTDGGRTWKIVLNYEGNNTPYYLYGVSAVGDTVMVSGFNNVDGSVGFVVKSTDGGQTWSDRIILTETGFVSGVKFLDSLRGIALDVSNYPLNNIYKTDSGGNNSKEWEQISPSGQDGWYGKQFSFLTSGRAAIAGINYCQSEDFGSKWNCRPSIDAVFDGGAYFFDDQHGWTSGGTISPEVFGWVHKTDDGGKTWSERILETHWPIRTFNFVTSKKGWAMGGDWYSGVGGIFSTDDGGQTWSWDMETGKEMSSCDTKQLIRTSSGPGFSKQLWCVGFDGDRNSVVYTKLIKDE